MERARPAVPDGRYALWPRADASQAILIFLPARAQNAPVTVVRKSLRKVRLDHLLVERGLVESREKAQARILAGEVLVAAQKLDKPGALVDSSAEIRLLGKPPRYVGRGGEKLEGALADFGIDVTGKNCLDIGSSTGGFVDCLLQHGARKVHAVDVGTNQLAWRLRQDKRVVVHENVNARYLAWKEIGEKADLITVDVSFISVRKILPALLEFCHPQTHFLLLVKPQFEVGKGQVGKGGIVRDPALQQAAVRKVREAAEELPSPGGLGLRVLEVKPSRLAGAEGNQEFFLHARAERLL